ncbi:MAG: SpaH/EbpB family LPXTG-anchored major pilin [Varibaculum sp.]|nr:SpaH/EbpB family LPXTG-anchored major pilin [Varibaculum sp.]
MTKTIHRSRMLAMMLAVLAALGFSALLPAAASAAPISCPETGCSVTVHPLTKLPGATHDNGKENTALADAAVDTDAKFKLQKVTDIDLTTNAGMTAALALTTANIGTHTLADGVEKAVAGNSIEFTNLEVGVYYLTQTAAGTQHSKAPASIIFVPMTDPDNTANWLTNIHVYPKSVDNSNLDPMTKTDITGDEKVLTKGSYIKWKIDGQIPPMAADDQMTQVEITDDAQTGLVFDTSGDKAAPESVTLVAYPDAGDPTKTMLVKDTDYTVTVTTSQMKVTFTDAGKSKVDNALKSTNPTYSKVKVETVLYTKIDSIPDGGALVNKAKMVTDTKNTEPFTQETDPDDPPTVVMGNLKVTAQNSETPPVTLANAKFKLYECAPAANQNAQGIVGDPITVDGVSEWTTGDDGTFTISGIRAGENTKLCLVNSQPPSGYPMLSEPKAVDFTKDAVLADDTDPVRTIEATVTYPGTTSDIINKLPLTGGQGIVLFLVIGLAMIGAGVYYTRRHRV